MIRWKRRETRDILGVAKGSMDIREPKIEMRMSSGTCLISMSTAKGTTRNLIFLSSKKNFKEGKSKETWGMEDSKKLKETIRKRMKRKETGHLRRQDPMASVVVPEEKKKSVRKIVEGFGDKLDGTLKRLETMAEKSNNLIAGFLDALMKSSVDNEIVELPERKEPIKKRKISDIAVPEGDTEGEPKKKPKKQKKQRKVQTKNAMLGIDLCCPYDGCEYKRDAGMSMSRYYNHFHAEHGDYYPPSGWLQTFAGEKGLVYNRQKKNFEWPSKSEDSLTEPPEPTEPTGEEEIESSC